MKIEQWINIALILQFLILTVIYISQGNWNKVLYWGGAAVITFSVYRMV